MKFVLSLLLKNNIFELFKKDFLLLLVFIINKK